MSFRLALKAASDDEVEQALACVRLEQEAEVRLIRQEAELRRSQRIEAKLDQLSKPHWTAARTFWATVIGVAVGVAALVVAIIALKHP